MLDRYADQEIKSTPVGGHGGRHGLLSGGSQPVATVPSESSKVLLIYSPLRYFFVVQLYDPLFFGGLAGSSRSDIEMATSCPERARSLRLKLLDLVSGMVGAAGVLRQKESEGQVLYEPLTERTLIATSTTK